MNSKKSLHFLHKLQCFANSERSFMLQVKRLQLQLQEEIELHTFLESVMEKDPWQLSSSSCSVPHQVCSPSSHPIMITF